MRKSKLFFSVIMLVFIMLIMLVMVNRESMPASTISPTPTLTPHPLLPQTISSEDGLITMRYPAEWIGELGVDGMINLYNRDEVKTTEVIGEGQIMANVRYILSEDLAGRTLPANATAQELVSIFTADLPPNMPSTFTNIWDVAGASAAIATGTITLNGQTADTATAVIVDADGAYGVMGFIISRDETADFIEIIEAMIVSFDYAPKLIDE